MSLTLPEEVTLDQLFPDATGKHYAIVAHDDGKSVSLVDKNNGMFPIDRVLADGEEAKTLTIGTRVVFDLNRVAVDYVTPTYAPVASVPATGSRQERQQG